MVAVESIMKRDRAELGGRVEAAEIPWERMMGNWPRMVAGWPRMREVSDS